MIDSSEKSSALPVQGQNFERLSQYTDWRRNWTIIVPGRFSDSPYSGLLFYQRIEGVAEFYQTDGQGGITLLKESGWGRHSWTIIVPGVFGNSGFSGLLLYDQETSHGAFYDTDGAGNLILLANHNFSPSTWTHIVAGAFTDSPYSGLLFYDQSSGLGAIYSTDGAGGITLLEEYSDWRTTWTHIVPGKFYSTGAIDSPVITDLFFYEGATGYGETYANENGQISLIGSQSGFPTAAFVLPGNFGTGEGWTDLLFYSKQAGRGSVYSETLLPQDDFVTANWTPAEDHTDWRPSWDIIVPGNFWVPEEEDQKFWTGYEERCNLPEGGFTDLLFYDSSKGTGEFYMHEPPNPTIVEPLQGYASSGSVLPGETISFHISSQLGTSSPYKIQIYRKGLQETLVADVEVTGPTIAYYINRSAYRDGAGWPEAARLVVPKNWPSGLYLARVYVPAVVVIHSSVERVVAPPDPIFPQQDGPATDIPFVVRGLPRNSARILLVISDTTYEAYNSWGGRSLYGFGHSGNHTWTYPQTVFRLPYAFRVSFQRPHTGLFDHGLKWQVTEGPFIRWLNYRGIRFDVCTASDLHKASSSAPRLWRRGCRLIVTVGHSEYWSKEMRDNVEAFVTEGGNAAFFGANICWWQVRFDEDGTMVCYKQARFDPNNVNDPQRQATVTVNWYDQPVNRPETSLTGVSYLGSPISYPPKLGHTVAEFEVQDPDHWVFANTGLKKNQMFGQYGNCQQTVVGSETDRRQPSSPANFHTLATVYVDDQGNEYEAATMGMFQKGSGTVFTAATINWAKGLSLEAHPNLMDIITQNVLTRLG